VKNDNQKIAIIEFLIYFFKNLTYMI